MEPVGQSLRERLLGPTLAVVAALVIVVLIWASAAGPAAAGPTPPANGFAGPIQAPPRAIDRALGPRSNAGMKQVPCAGEPASVATCYVAPASR